MISNLFFTFENQLLLKKLILSPILWYLAFFFAISKASSLISTPSPVTFIFLLSSKNNDIIIHPVPVPKSSIFRGVSLFSSKFFIKSIINSVSGLGSRVLVFTKKSLE